MAVFMNTHKSSIAYLVVHDNVYDSVNQRFEEERIYGILKLNIDELYYIEIFFFNEIDQIDLGARFVTRAEWETMEAFGLFPVLKPFGTQVTIEQDDVTRRTFKAAEFKVRFRDY